MTSPVQQFDASQISDEMLKASDDGLPHPEHQRHEVCHRCNEHKDKSTRYQRCLDQINEGRLHHDHLYVDHYCQDQLDICISKISRKPIQHGTKIFSEEPAATEHESQDTCSIDTPISTEVATSNLDVINEEEEAITPSQPSTEVPPDYSRPDQVSSDPLQPVGPPRMRGTSIGQALAAVDRRKRGSSLSQPLRPGDPRRRGKSLGYQATHVSLLELEFRRQLILVDIFGPRDHFPMDPIPISSLQTVSPPVERKEDNPKSSTKDYTIADDCAADDSTWWEAHAQAKHTRDHQHQHRRPRPTALLIKTEEAPTISAGPSTPSTPANAPTLTLSHPSSMTSLSRFSSWSEPCTVIFRAMIEDEIRRGVKLEDEDILELQALRWKGPLPGTGAGTGEGEGCGQGGVELDYEAWAELAIVKRKEQLWKKGIDLEAMEVLAGMAVNAWMRNGRRGSGMGEALRRDLFKGVSGGSKRTSWSEDPDPDRYSQVPGRWVEGE